MDIDQVSDVMKPYFQQAKESYQAAMEGFEEEIDEEVDDDGNVSEYEC